MKGQSLNTADIGRWQLLHEGTLPSDPAVDKEPMLHYLNNAMHRAEQKLLQDEKPTPWSLADEFSKFKMLFEG